MLELDDELKEQFKKQIKKYVGDKYATLFEEKRVVSRQKITEVSKTSKNTLFLGYTGTGKTMAMIYLAWQKFYNYEINRGKMLSTQKDCWLPHYKLKWFHSVELCRMIQTQAKNNYTDYPYPEIFIDDFGLFSIKPWEQSDFEYWFEMLVTTTESSHWLPRKFRLTQSKSRGNDPSPT